MKDMYSFDIDRQGAIKAYQQVCIGHHVYENTSSLLYR